MIPDTMQIALTTPQIDENILQIKQQLLALGSLHPGSVSRQYQVCGKPGCKCCDPQKPKPHGPYTKLTYAYHGKFTCRFVRAQAVAEVTALVATFKKFRQLTDDWIALAIQRAQLGPLQPTGPRSKRPKNPRPRKSSRRPKKAR
jgi:hypothetical protein